MARRVAFVLTTVLLGALAPLPSRAAETVALRAALHDDYARIVFAWPAPVAYQAHVEGETLTLHFARPLTVPLEPLTRRLARYVARAAFSPDHQTITAALKQPVTVKTAVLHGDTIAIDLFPSQTASAAPAPAAAPTPATGPAPSEALPVRLDLRHSGKAVQLGFLWPHGVRYGFSQKAGEARLAFGARGGIDAASLDKALPGLNAKVATGASDTVVSFAVSTGLHIRPVRLRDGVMLEITGLGKLPEAPVQTASTQAAPPAPAQTASASPPPFAAVKPAVAAPAVPPPASLAVHYLIDNGNASLRFDWPMATQAAVYRRGVAIWIVFAAPTRLDLAEPQQHGQPLLHTIEQVPIATATVLRLVTGDGINPSVRRAGSSWIVDLKTQDVRTDAPILADARPSAQSASVLFHVRQASAAIRLPDPDFGDTVLVVPVGEIGRGIDVARDFVDFHLLPSVEGVVLRPLSDGLAVTPEADDVVVTRPGGLALSSDRDSILGKPTDGIHRLFNLAAWRGAAGTSFLARRSALEQVIAAAPLGARGRPRLDLAHFYFAHFFAPETASVLDALAHDDPQLGNDVGTRAMQGAVCLMMRDMACAAQGLNQAALNNDPEAALWRGSLAAETGDWEAAARNFIQGVSLLTTYPQPMRDRFALQAAEAMLNTGRDETADPLLDLVLQGKPTVADAAMGIFLKGRRELQAGQLEPALESWVKVAGMGDRPSRAYALYARAMALFDHGKVNRPDTIKALDALRFSWRGDDFEFTLLRRLGELKLAEGDHAGGLEALREDVANFADYPQAKDVAKELGDGFAAIFLGKAAADVPPLQALALYDGFRTVEPPGPRSDAIVGKLIDRLVSVDLLDRAGALLDTQVKTRMTGRDKARGATQLALLRLMDHDPAAAVTALDIDVGNDLSPDLARQRQQLRARALLDLQKPADALTILASDNSRDADRLRADIYWKTRNWPEAAKVFARLAGQPPADGKLDADTSQLVLSWAAALTLDGDQADLVKLRQGFGPGMAKTPQAQAFHVIAGDGDGAPTDGSASAIAKSVAQIGELQSFMAAYQKRVADQKLSAIN